VVDAEVSKVCKAAETSDRVAGTDSESNTFGVCALEIGVHPQRLDNGSRMSGDVHVRFCERLEVKLPRPTYPEGASGQGKEFLKRAAADDDLWEPNNVPEVAQQMSGDVHVRFCKRLRVKLPRPTYPEGA
jgi:hypothetical protein